MNKEAIFKFRVPARFAVDHWERMMDHTIDVDTIKILEQNSRTALIAGSREAMLEFLDDASYYSDPYGPNMIDKSLKRSAAATVKSLSKQLWNTRTWRRLECQN